VTPVEEQLRDLVAEVAELDAADLDLRTPFPEADIDSLLAMEIAVHVEKKFGVRFEDTDMKRVQSIADLAQLVEERSRA
jgi:acyl carrier protein